MRLFALFSIINLLCLRESFLHIFLRFQKPLFGISFLVFHFLWIIFHQIGIKLNYTKRVID